MTIAYECSFFRKCRTWGYANKKVSKYPKGIAAKVFYDPANPEVSCLESGGIGWEDVFMLIVSISGVFMAGYFVNMYSRKLFHFNEAERFEIEAELPPRTGRGFWIC